MSKHRKHIHTGSKDGSGLGVGHGGNTFNLPMIREVEDWSKWVSLPIEPGSRFFRMGTKITIILSHSPDYGWHMSIAHPERYPTWDEIAYARYTLIPNEVTIALMLPPKEQYVNFHNNCFQLHQVYDKAAPTDAFVMVNNAR